MNRILSIACSLMLAAGVASAQVTWKLDKAHSQVKFSVSHMVVGEVTGRFTDFDVTMTTVQDDLTDATIEAIIKTASINTDNERRDGHLRSDDFLNAEKYPELKFKSTSVEKTGKDTYRVRGDFTMRDITKGTVLDTKFNGTVKDGRGNTKAGFKATTTINRFEFGTKWDSKLDTGGFIAGEDVEVTLLMEFTKQDPEKK